MGSGPIASCVATISFNQSIKYNQNLNTIGKLSLSSSALSLVGSLSIIGFTIWKRIWKQPDIRPLLHLTIADLLLSLLWISAASSYFSEDHNDIHSETIRHQAVSCFVWQLLTEIAHLSTFFLTVNYSINVCLQMKEQTDRVHGISDSRRFEAPRIHAQIKTVLYILSWILPTILMMPIIVNTKVKYISACQKCVILLDVPRLQGDISETIKSYGYMILVSSLAFSIICIIVLYSLTLKMYWKAVPGFHTDRQRKQLANMQTRITLYMLVFLCCWGPALMLASMKLNEIRVKSYADEVRLHKMQDVIDCYPYFILQAICAPLQGCLNSLVYGWTRKSFRHAGGAPETRRGLFYSTPYHNYDYLDEPLFEDSIEVTDKEKGMVNSHNRTPLPW